MRPYHVRAAQLLIPAVLLAAFIAHAQDKSKPPAIPAKDWKNATAFKVLRVIDGDTIEIQQDGKAVKVRLIGVDTPETVHPSKPVEEYGKEARACTWNSTRTSKTSTGGRWLTSTAPRTGCSSTWRPSARGTATPTPSTRSTPT